MTNSTWTAPARTSGTPSDRPSNVLRLRSKLPLRLAPGLTIEVLDARADPAAAAQFLAGQRQAYARMTGLAEFVPTLAKLQREGTFVLAVRDAEGYCGGIRVDCRGPHPLSVEAAFDGEWLRERLDRGGDPVGELSGTWVAPRLRGSDLSRTLVVAAMAAAAVLGLRRCYGATFCQLVPLYGELGFEFIVDRPGSYPGMSGAMYVTERDVEDFTRPSAPFAADVAWWIGEIAALCRGAQRIAS